jgi:uncharacterized membrane protein
MGIKSKLRLIGATVLSFSLIHLGSAHLPLATGWQTEGDRAVATTGGRARGGSFDEPVPAEPVPDEGGSYGGGDFGGGGFYDGEGYSQPDLTPYQSDPYGYSYDDPYYSGGRSRPYYSRDPYYQPPVVVPLPNSGGYGYGSGSGYSTTAIGIPPIFMLAAIGLFLFAPFLLMGQRFRSVNRRSSLQAGHGGNELLNDIVTVTRLQVALLAGARPLQAALDQIASRNNLQSREGLTSMLQETALALLRSPEYWSHVRVDSQTVNSRQEASRLFEQLSIEERSKVRSETLVNLRGQVQRQPTQFSTADNPDSGYIVVTLLLGTGDDRPLLGAIHSTTELQTALQQLGSISPQALMVFELLWTPQDPGDVLSRDELISEYPTMTQL